MATRDEFCSGRRTLFSEWGGPTPFACGITRLCQAMMAAPAFLFLATLTLIMFRPPNIDLFPADRIVFLLLTIAVVFRMLILRQQVPFVFWVSIPMAGLVLLAMAGYWIQPFDAEAWSLIAAKFVVPFVMFHLAALVFTNERTIRRMELFSVLALAYLCVVSIAFLIGADYLIFPRFILDGGVEMHADRARGPFLQAVANGAALNMLGLVLLHLYQRRRIGSLIALPLLLALPIAILATMTRSVWSSAVISIALFMLLAESRPRRTPIWIGLAAVLAVSVLTVACSNTSAATQERLEDRDTVNFRMAVYQACWEMVKEKPVLGGDKVSYRKKSRLVSPTTVRKPMRRTTPSWKFWLNMAPSDSFSISGWFWAWSG